MFHILFMYFYSENSFMSQICCSLRHIYFSVSCIFSSFIILFHFYAQKSSVVSEMSDVDGRIQEEHDKVSE